MNKNVVVDDTGASAAPAMRIEATLAQARDAGLLGGKTARIGVRVSPELLQAARESTGLKTDSEILEYALASVALVDRFPETFRQLRGTVDPDLKLGY